MHVDTLVDMLVDTLVDMPLDTLVDMLGLNEECLLHCSTERRRVPPALSAPSWTTSAYLLPSGPDYRFSLHHCTIASLHHCIISTGLARFAC